MGMTVPAARIFCRRLPAITGASVSLMRFGRISLLSDKNGWHSYCVACKRFFTGFNHGHGMAHALTYNVHALQRQAFGCRLGFPAGHPPLAYRPHQSQSGSVLLAPSGVTAHRPGTMPIQTLPIRSGPVPWPTARAIGALLSAPLPRPPSSKPPSQDPSPPAAVPRPSRPALTMVLRSLRGASQVAWASPALASISFAS
jgi:hypothetical protein